MTAYRKPATSDNSTMVLMREQAERHGGECRAGARRSRPGRSADVCSPAATATAIDGAVRCASGQRLPREKEARLSLGILRVNRSASRRTIARTVTGAGCARTAREGGDCSTGTSRSRETRRAAPTAMPVARARQTAAPGLCSRPGRPHPACLRDGTNAIRGGSTTGVSATMCPATVSFMPRYHSTGRAGHRAPCRCRRPIRAR